jgi:hypothetical protein
MDGQLREADDLSVLIVGLAASAAIQWRTDAESRIRTQRAMRKLCVRLCSSAPGSGHQARTIGPLLHDSKVRPKHGREPSDLR